MGDECLSALLKINQDPSWRDTPQLIDSNGLTICKEAIALIEDLQRDDTEKKRKKKFSICKSLSMVDCATKFKMTGLALTLKHLNISKNKITDKGAKLI